MTLAAFFSTSEPPLDPKVLFDRNATNQRFFVTATQLSSSVLRLAVSRSANPSDLNPSSWCHYSWSTTNDFDPTTPDTFADQPKIGAGTDAFLVSSDYYTLTTFPAFTYAVIYAFNKISLTNNSASCPTATARIFVPASTNGDLDTLSLQPVNHYNQASSFTGSTNPVYLVNSLWTDETTTQKNYKVWRIRNLLSGTSPMLQVATAVGSYSYQVPPDARQFGTTQRLDTTDARITLAAGASNALWVAHGTSCQSGGGENESCIRVVRINAGQDGNGAPTVTVTQQTVFGGGADTFYWMPGIAVNVNHRTVVPFLISSASQYQGSAWTAKNASTANYSILNSLGVGSCPRTVLGRSGDYVGAHTDPTDFLSFWVTAEHAAPSASGCRWATNVSTAQ